MGKCGSAFFLHIYENDVNYGNVLIIDIHTIPNDLGEWQYLIVFSRYKQITTTTPSCSGPILAQQFGVIQYQGLYFPTQFPKWIVIIPFVLVGKNTLDWYITCHGYINNHRSPFIGPIKMYRKFEKLPSLDSGHPEMKCLLFSYFHRDCWGEKIT